jgi:hypothetical protein
MGHQFHSQFYPQDWRELSPYRNPQVAWKRWEIYAVCRRPLAVTIAYWAGVKINMTKPLYHNKLRLPPCLLLLKHINSKN